MSKGGHNWKGGGTIEDTRSLDIMQLARAGLLADRRSAWHWTYQDGTRAWIEIRGGKDEIVLDYRVRSPGEDWKRSISRFRSAGHLAASAANGPGSSALFEPMASTADGASPTSTARAGCSRAAIAIGSPTPSSAAIRSTASVINWRAYTISSARVMAVRMNCRRPSRNGCGGRPTTALCRGSRPVRIACKVPSLPGQSGYSPNGQVEALQK